MINISFSVLLIPYFILPPQVDASWNFGYIDALGEKAIPSVGEMGPHWYQVFCTATFIDVDIGVSAALCQAHCLCNDSLEMIPNADPNSPCSEDFYRFCLTYGSGGQNPDGTNTP